MRRILATKESLTAVNGSKIMEELDETPVAKKCSRCVYDESVPNIVFDEAGVCNYCQLYDSLNRQYPNTGTEGEKRLQELVDEIRVGGKGKKYDCVVGVSGGCDSSFLLHTLVGKGVRPLAMHFDNT